MQSGVAFGEFEHAARTWTSKDLAGAVTSKQVKSGELLWQDGELCVADDCRDPTKVTVLPLKGGDPRKFAEKLAGASTASVAGFESSEAT